MNPETIHSALSTRRARPRLALWLLPAFLVLATSIPAQSRREQARLAREAQNDLRIAIQTFDTGAFVPAARDLLVNGGTRGLREVVEGYGTLLDRAKDMDPEEFYRFHRAIAKLLGRIEGKSGPKELAKLRDRAKHWQARLVLLDAASLSPTETVEEAAWNALEDKAPQVVRRSLFYLRNIADQLEDRERKLAALDKILDRFKEIGNEKRFKGSEWDRTRLGFCSALTKILKISLQNAEDYENYLIPRRDRADLFDPKEAGGGGRTKVTLFGTEVTGKRIAFVLDVSGSMRATDKVQLAGDPKRPKTFVRGSKEEAAYRKELIESRRRITRAKRELSKVVAALPEDVSFNIIAYASDVRPWKERLAPCSDKSRKEAKAFIGDMKADGVTITDIALEVAFQDLEVDTIYLITDGAPTHQGSRSNVRPPDADAIIASIHERTKILNFLRGVRIFTLGFPEAEEEFLKRLSKEHQGAYSPIR